MSAAHTPTGSPTPTPWELIEATEHHGPYIAGPRGDICDFYTMSNLAAASVRNGGDSKPVEFCDASANAAFVVTACNSHDALVEALQSVLDGLGCQPGYVNYSGIARARAALALAGQS